MTTFLLENWLIIGSNIVSTIIGILIARKHPAIANKVAAVLTFGRDKANDIIKGVKG